MVSTPAPGDTGVAGVAHSTGMTRPHTGLARLATLKQGCAEHGVMVMFRLSNICNTSLG